MNQSRTKQSGTQVHMVLGRLPAVISGDAPDPTGWVSWMYREMGMALLADLHAAYLVKSAGGTDAAGISWPDLKPETKAYSRDHPGLHRKKMGERPRGMLTEKQDKKWRALFRSGYAHFRKTGAGETEAKGHAAAWAWTVLKREGAVTMILVFGGAHVPILIKTGALLASLEAGGPNNILRPEQHGVFVGSSLPYAGAHQAGVPGRLPQRQLWPEEGDLPKEWAEHLTAVMDKWMPRIIGALVERGA
jgi:hypothetical protein